MTVLILALGNEKDETTQDIHDQPGLIWAYLDWSSSFLQLQQGVINEFCTFTLYEACVFGKLFVTIYDCPFWELFEGRSWYSSRNPIAQADIIVIKYSVNNKPAFQEVKHSFIPMIKKFIKQWTVPIIVAAVGARANGDGPSCTCPLCASDKGNCIPSSEGLQIARELGATYLELHSLNDFNAGKYFGGVLEYFIMQCSKQKSSESLKRKKACKSKGLKPPQLGQPVKLPVVKIQNSSYTSELLGLLGSPQFADVSFCAEGTSVELVHAHRVVLCSSSRILNALLSVQGVPHVKSSSLQAAQRLLLVKENTLESLDTSTNIKNRHVHSPPMQIHILDPLLSRCLPETLQFIYSGNTKWHMFQNAVREKLVDAKDVKDLLEKVCLLLGIEQQQKTEQTAIMRATNSTSWLGYFFNSPVFHDVVFKVQGVSIPAHRAVLSARCKVMAAMFSGHYAEASSCEVSINAVSTDTFLSFLEYLYTDICCPASVLQAMALLICAEMYQVSRLQQICEVYITTCLQSMPSRELASTSLSIINLLKKAQFHNAEQLSSWLLHFISSNYLIFSQKADFLDLTEEDQDFIEKHRWPSRVYMQDLAKFRQQFCVQKSCCAVM
ncbi:rho-related BTB domain-containing protein 3 [Erpetoichthys calabaricus]|uniref:Rho related BTB domain containing 3 n=1 Tax=Erpetoichthys calabaricus TaxID=27687 RepID=A0A8C4S6K9_ERPCA|nr:rho-related BTB domain-containing protein 3 [Erpetoichthys calabaricus]